MSTTTMSPFNSPHTFFDEKALMPESKKMWTNRSPTTFEKMMILATIKSLQMRNNTKTTLQATLVQNLFVNKINRLSGSVSNLDTITVVDGYLCTPIEIQPTYLEIIPEEMDCTEEEFELERQLEEANQNDDYANMWAGNYIEYDETDQ